MKGRGRLAIGGVLSILLSLVMLSWALQTAWLGSFPGREGQPYALWALAQLVTGLALLIGGVVALYRAVKGSPGRK